MRRALYTILFACLIFLCAKGVSYAQISVSALLDKRTVEVGDIAYLSISVEGVTSADSAPFFTVDDAFHVSFRGSGSRIVNVNGKVSASIDFNYILEPTKEGTFEIKDIAFEHNGKVYKAQPIAIEVKKTEDTDIFVRAEVSNRSPYLNEQIIFSVKFYTRVRVTQPSFNVADFTDFIYRDIGVSNSYEEEFDGKKYLVLELARYALFPQKSGELIIPHVKVMTEVVTMSNRPKRGLFLDDGNDYKPKRLRTKEVTLNVSHLPEYKNDEVPFSGLIGEFKMDTSLGTSILNVGDSTTLTVTLYGVGNIGDIVSLTAIDSRDFKTYDDKPLEKIQVKRDGVLGTKVFKRAFIPLREGELTVPSIRFSYFDTKKGDYAVLATKEYKLNVRPSPEENLNLVEMAGTRKETVKIIRRDILPLNTSLDSLRNEEVRVNGKFAVILSLLPGFIYFFVLFQVRKRETYKGSESILRRKNAYKNFSKTVHDLNKMILDNDKDFCIRLLIAFKSYVGDRFNIHGTAMTADELNKVLLDKGIDKDEVDKITGAMKKVEMANYASKDLSNDDKRGLMETFLSITKKVEKKS